MGLKELVKRKIKVKKAEFKARDVSTAEIKQALKNPAKARKAGLSSQTLRGFENELDRRKRVKKEKNMFSTPKKSRSRSPAPKLKRRKGNLTDLGEGTFSFADNIDKNFGLDEPRKIGFKDDFDPFR